MPDKIPVTMKIPEPLIAPKRPISRFKMAGPWIFLEVSFSHYATLGLTRIDSGNIVKDLKIYFFNSSFMIWNCSVVISPFAYLSCRISRADVPFEMVFSLPVSRRII